MQTPLRSVSDLWPPKVFHVASMNLVYTRAALLPFKTEQYLTFGMSKIKTNLMIYLLKFIRPVYNKDQSLDI